MSVCHGCGTELPPKKAPGRARKWCSDRCRKLTLYASRCLDCGTVINTDGRVTEAAVRCVSCNGRHQYALTHQWILDSIAEWRDLFERPPSPHDWNFAMSRSRMRQPDDCYGRALARYEPTGRPWPSPTAVYSHFDSWPDALRAAGLEPLAPNERWIGHAGMALRRDDEAVAA